jgi:hypothetical protein
MAASSPIAPKARASSIAEHGCGGHHADIRVKRAGLAVQEIGDDLEGS